MFVYTYSATRPLWQRGRKLLARPSTWRRRSVRRESAWMSMYSGRGTHVCGASVCRCRLCTQAMSSDAASKCRRRVCRGCSGGVVWVEAVMRG